MYLTSRKKNKQKLFKIARRKFNTACVRSSEAKTESLRKACYRRNALLNTAGRRVPAAKSEAEDSVRGCA